MWLRKIYSHMNGYNLRFPGPLIRDLGLKPGWIIVQALPGGAILLTPLDTILEIIRKKKGAPEQWKSEVSPPTVSGPPPGKYEPHSRPKRLENSKTR